MLFGGFHWLAPPPEIKFRKRKKKSGWRFNIICPHFFMHCPCSSLLQNLVFSQRAVSRYTWRALWPLLWVNLCMWEPFKVMSCQRQGQGGCSVYHQEVAVKCKGCQRRRWVVKKMADSLWLKNHEEALWSSVLSGRTNSEYSWATWLVSLLRSKAATRSSSPYMMLSLSVSMKYSVKL